MAEDRETEPTDESTPAVDDASTEAEDPSAEADPLEDASDDGAAAPPAKRDKTRVRGKSSEATSADEDAASSTTGSSGKGHATPKRRQVEKTPQRTTPVSFVSESVAELRKVVYPTAIQLRTYFVVVLVFVLFVIAYVSLLDLGFGWVILKVLGG